MFAPTRSTALHRAVTTVSLPDFLLPAFSTRSFSSTARLPSRIGRTPITVPPEVTLTLVDPPPAKSGAVRRIEPPRTVAITGPLGTLNLPLPDYMIYTHDASENKVSLSIPDKTERAQREMWGTTRALLANHVAGVSEGHIAILRLNGVGYRATIEKAAITKAAAYPGQDFVNLKLGYGHPIEMGVPEGVKASVPAPTRILLEGRDREVVRQFAAEIRRWRKPEPYKGKGIFVDGETIKLKAKKIK